MHGLLYEELGLLCEVEQQLQPGPVLSSHIFVEQIVNEFIKELV